MIGTMEKRIEESVEKTYESIRRNVPCEAKIDSLEVVKQVVGYRQFWKPEKVNVMLLAESHVYTDEQDYEMRLNGSILNSVAPGYPLRFVRFVYCLGYGENELLLSGARANRRNGGTPQYWKIFSSCVAENETDLGFRRILKTGVPSLQMRLRNKVDILRKMMEKGVWLVDVSIVGLYGGGKKNYTVNSKIIEICWKDHIENVILESSPKHVIVIGKGVGNIICSELRKLGIHFTVVPQPQARGTSQWQLENYKRYQLICAKYCGKSGT